MIVCMHVCVCVCVLFCVTYMYMCVCVYDPNNPYDVSSTDDKVPDTDVSELAEAFT